VNQVKVNEVILSKMLKIKTVIFLAKQTELEMEVKGTDFQQNMMLVLSGSCETRGIH
jgi:hypothetical protein